MGAGSRGKIGRPMTIQESRRFFGPRAYRALAKMSGETSKWLWIGAHTEYERLIAK